MRIEMPDYRNGTLTGREPHIIELDEEKYCKTINDCLNKFYDYYNIDEMANTLRKLTAYDLLIEEIKEKVGNGKLLKIHADEIENYKKNYIRLFVKDMSDYAVSHYKNTIEEWKKCHKRIIMKEATFLKENKEAIIEALIEDKNKVIEFIKNKRCEDNKRYYDNKKKKLGIVERIKKTPEEVMEAKRLAAKKFYYKNKELEKINKCSENEEQI